MALHPLAAGLNASLEQVHPALWSLLSKKGRAAYFPSTGILGQTAEAKGKRYNATIGIALDEEGIPLILSDVSSRVTLPPADIVPYAPSFGVPAVRHAWSEQLKAKNPSLTGAYSLPVVTAGLTHALSVAGALVLDPGDSVIVPDPYWGNYKLIFEAAYGAILRPFPIFSGASFNADGLRVALSGRGKHVLLLNFPHNPTGYTPLLREAECLVDIIRGNAEVGGNIVVILDDAYAGFMYENDVLRESLFGMLADLHERVLVIKVDGSSKEDYAWGLRIGFLTYASKNLGDAALRALEQKTGGLIRGSVSSSCILSQSLLLETFRSPSSGEEKREKEQLLASRFRIAKSILLSKKFDQYWEFLPCNSGYFLCIRLRDGLDAERIRKLLLSEYDTGVIALGRLLRIAFSSVPLEDLPELFSRIAAACERVASPSPMRHEAPALV